MHENKNWFRRQANFAKHRDHAHNHEDEDHEHITEPDYTKPVVSPKKDNHGLLGTVKKEYLMST